MSDPIRRDGVTFFIPPGEESPDSGTPSNRRLATIDDAVDLVFLFQPIGDALLACLDHHRHVVLVAETHAEHLADLVPVLAGLDMVDLVVVLTASHSGTGLREDDVLMWHRLRGEFGAADIEVVDWLDIDQRGVSSMARLTGFDDPWCRSG
jgi:hypothetical protein